MNGTLPQMGSYPMQFTSGRAVGKITRWRQGQCCAILTEAGFVGCGIYDVKAAAGFGQAVAIACGSFEKPVSNPEDLLDARIVDATPQAIILGIRLGMTGREAVEALLAASPESC
jgi:uncharacterized protein YunC (DUF1805 family)